MTITDYNDIWVFFFSKINNITYFQKVFMTSLNIRCIRGGNNQSLFVRQQNLDLSHMLRFYYLQTVQVDILAGRK